MKIAFVGHIYHKKTASSEFFINEILKFKDVKITYYWDESADKPEKKLDILVLENLNPDVVIIWQSESTLLDMINKCSTSFLRKIVFVPMFDSVKMVNNNFWEKLNNIRILNFCFEVEKICKRNNLNSFYIQYMPHVECNMPLLNYKTAFFWQRRKEINFGYLTKIFKKLGVKKILFHNAPDPVPDNDIVYPSIVDRLKFTINFTNWFETKSEFVNYVKQAGIYIAPRVYEGIGMGFLEAMARGAIVVSPNHPTMNEYLKNEYNGVLYDTNEVDENISANLDYNLLGYNAHKSALSIRSKYLQNISHAINFALHGELKKVRNVNLPYTHKQTIANLLTIIIVVKNNIKGLIKTIDCLKRQSANYFQILVVDGYSSDGAQDYLINQNINFISEIDTGIYDAMNKGVKLSTTEWVMFINSGDEFAHDGVIEEMTDVGELDNNVAFIVGRHIYHDKNKNTRTLCTPETSDNILIDLKKNQESLGITSQIPCHQATIVRRDLLVKFPYDTTYKIAADHDNYYKLICKGFKNLVKNTIVLVYESGGFSSANSDICMDEWKLIIRSYSTKNEKYKRCYQVIF